MNIMAMKLVTGEELLGDVIKTTDTTFTIENPVGIAVIRGKDGQPNVGFTPFPLHSEQKTGSTIDLQLTHIVYSYIPAEDFIKNYNQIFGAGIILPPTQQIITG
jgi:hypothetical protein